MPDWESGTVGVLIVKDDKGTCHRRRDEPALVLGPMAVHPCVDPGKEDLWCVTHSPSGGRFCKVKTDDDAVKIAEAVVAVVGEPLWDWKTFDELRANFPADLRDWLLACNRSECYNPMR